MSSLLGIASFPGRSPGHVIIGMLYYITNLKEARTEAVKGRTRERSARSAAGT
jgi:hypothetical protein